MIPGQTNTGKSRVTVTPDSTWISASATYNYMMRDPLLDWLNQHSKIFARKNQNYSRAIDKCRDLSTFSFPAYIKDQGNIFEKEVLASIIKEFGSERVISIDGSSDCRNPAKVQETLAAMRKGIPFIYSG